jgi:uncharacterized protein YkwD
MLPVIFLVGHDTRGHTPSCSPKFENASRVCFLVSIFCAIASGVAADSIDLPLAEKLVVNLTNEFRTREGRGTLILAPKLDETAQDFAEFMARTDKYGHAADGKQPAARAKQHGYDPCIVAENIAYQYRSAGFSTQELAHGFVQGWMDSPGHRKNMLDADVTETAVAIAQSGKSGYYYASSCSVGPNPLRLDSRSPTARPRSFNIA